MAYPVHQTAIDRHTQLLGEAEQARLCQQSVFVLEISLPASQRRGFRIALLRLVLWPKRLDVSL